MTVNLYWKLQNDLVNVDEAPFVSERQLEEYIFGNQEILGGDISIIFHQIRTGNRQGIPDMLGVDQNGHICLLELKNVEADEAILPQALGYAIWAETNPDSIKAIWLESANRPDVSMDWDHLNIRIILVAPAFRPGVARMAAKVGYPVDLVQIRRYSDRDNEFLLVENITDTTAAPRIRTTKVQEDYSWEGYEELHGQEATAQVRQMVEAIDTFIREQGWSVPYNLTRDYVGFKLGSRLVAIVGWTSTRGWSVYLKLPQDYDYVLKSPLWESGSYDTYFKQVAFRPLQPQAPNLGELEPLIVTSYRHISGEK